MFGQYLVFLLFQNALDLLKTNLFSRADTYTHEDLDELNQDLTNAVQSEQAKSHALWVLQLLLELYRQKNYTPPAYLDFLLQLVKIDPTTPLHEKVLELIAKAIKGQDVDRSAFARSLTNLAYSHNFSTIRNVYEILFSLWPELKEEGRTKIRDLIYQHLLPEADDDEDLLKIALFAIDKDFDLNGAEPYLTKFIQTALDADNDVSTYYERMAKIMLKRLEGYHTKDFNDIKQQLKEFIDRPQSEDDRHE